MSENDLYDDDDVTEIDEDDDFEDVVMSPAARKRNSLEVRRRIEQMLELKRLREFDETIGLEDLEW